MIRMYKRDNGGELAEIQGFAKDCWINVHNPEAKEIEDLSRTFGIPQDFLTDALDLDERARIEVEDGKTLIIVRIPVHYDTNLEIPYNTLPLGIILLEDAILTICALKSPTLQEFLDGRVKDFSTARRSRFVVQIFGRTVMQYLRYLKHINAFTAILEKELRQTMKNEELFKLLNIVKGLVYFTTSLKTNDLAMERFRRLDPLRMSPEEKDLIEDILIDNRQAQEMAQIYSSILSGMMDAFASLINNNVSEVMKVLTLVTIIIMLPNLVASIYGMNVPLPLQERPYAFAVVVGISMLLAGSSIFYFVKKKWF
jgi:magnesium transporter